MTHEVQGRMLLREWFAWWEAIARMEAERQVGDYNTLVLGNPGWGLDDRAQRLDRLYRLAYGDVVMSAPPSQTSAGADADEAERFRQHTRNVFGWLSNAMGNGVFYGQGRAN